MSERTYLVNLDRGRASVDEQRMGYQWIRTLEAERKQLQVIVDNLPRTQDGVPVVLGMVVWTRPAVQLLVCLVEAIGIQDGRVYLCLSETPADGPFGGGTFRFCRDPSECFADLCSVANVPKSPPTPQQQTGQSRQV